MDRFDVDFLDRMGWLHSEIEKQLQDLPKDALDWSPGREIPSICVLVTHTAGAERFWIGDVAAGDPSNRDRDSEFAASGKDRGELFAILRGSRQYAGEVIKKIDYKKLSSPCISPRDGKEITIGWALNYALEHTAIHLGHIQIIRQLWELRADEFGGK